MFCNYTKPIDNEIMHTCMFVCVSFEVIEIEQLRLCIHYIGDNHKSNIHVCICGQSREKGPPR